MSIIIVNRYTNAVIKTIASDSLIELDLSGADLYEANLYGSNLYGADLSRANLSGANFYGADLSRANLSRANLSRANLYGSNLSRANLYGSNLYGADLSEANLYRANLSEANLSRANLSRANFYGADLSRAKGLLPNEIIPLQIYGTRHYLIVREVGHITIGCEHRPVDWWEQHYRAVGRREHYTPAQVNEYRNFIALAKYWMRLHGVLEVEVEA